MHGCFHFLSVCERKPWNWKVMKKRKIFYVAVIHFPFRDGTGLLMNVFFYTIPPQ